MASMLAPPVATAADADPVVVQRLSKDDVVDRREATIRSRSHGYAAGFTLLEIVVVLAILGVSAVLISGYKPPWSRGLAIDAAAAELAAQLRMVRSEAIADNRPASLELDLLAHRYVAGHAPPRNLPPELSMQLLTTAGEQPSPSVGDIRFNPDGSSTGGRILLMDGSRRVAVRADWLTGRISVADVR